MRRPDIGVVIVVAGPDGCGKTTVVRALERLLAGRPVRVFQHRPKLFPSRTQHSGPVLEPHKDPPYSAWLSLAKLMYVFLDFQLGWLLRIVPFKRRGGVVLFERGWWDLLVDQRRYRLQVPPAAIRALGRLVPRPDLTLVLTGSAANIYARKPELPLPELARQLDAWKSIAGQRSNFILIHVDEPIEQVVEQTTRAVTFHLSGFQPAAV